MSPLYWLAHKGNTLSIVINSSTMCSLISLDTVHKLGLNIHKTIHKAVQVDGQSPLKVIGKVHTQFTRGAITLTFSGLVVHKMLTSVLGGTNFLIENDVYCRMAKGTISIGSNCTVLSTPPNILKLD